MNRIVLIGNGFDIAHGLNTRYSDFINWYWKQWLYKLKECESNLLEDEICKFALKDSQNTWLNFLYCHSLFTKDLNGSDFIELVKSNTSQIIFEPCAFLKTICTCLDVQNWVDIENIYYSLLNASHGNTDNVKKLNKELDYLKTKLVGYLSTIRIDKNIKSNYIQEKILEPFNPRDIMVSDRDYIDEHFKYWIQQDTKEHILKLSLYNKVGLPTTFDIDNLKKDFTDIKSKNINLNQYDVYRDLFLIPDNILLLNFNYTKTVELYQHNFPINYIHGSLYRPQTVIFGYGDEMDEKYQTLRELNDNEYLKNIKSIKYLEADNYRKLLAFIESAPYQIYIMGHSCGNSDRTLLNTLFEHPNCVSIKPFFYVKDDLTDNYLDIVQNISRNFNNTNMKQMRNKVVNKTFCEPLFNII